MRSDGATVAEVTLAGEWERSEEAMTERVAGSAGLRTAAVAACMLGMVCLASPAGAADVQPCALLDAEAWRGYPEVSAGKVAAEKIVGEPRTVRMIYFVPTVRPYRQSVVDTMKATMRMMQTFFAVQMAAHGYGYMTFRYEADADGEPVVHRMDGAHGDAHYLVDTTSRSGAEIWEVYEHANRVDFIVIDHSTSFLHDRYGIVYALGAAGGSKNEGIARVTADFSWETATHELAHAFGMPWHDFRDDSYVLSYGRRRTRLSACTAAVLSLSPFFNAEISLETDRKWGPTVEHASGTPWYPAGSERVSVPMRVADPDGVVLVLLQVANHLSDSLAPENKACRTLSGETAADVAFEYDGVIPGASRTHPSLSNPATHFLVVKAFDAKGDVGWLNFAIAQRSPYHLATLEATCEEHITPLAFSPDGRLLAAGSRTSAFSPSVLSVWDVASRREIAAWEPHSNTVMSLAFSPDGTVLVSGSWDRTIRVWDVASKEAIAVLEGQGGLIDAVSFSPDGAILASDDVRGNGAVSLWDTAVWQRIATLEAPRHRTVYHVMFSPDGRVLAVSTSFGRLNLFDVVSGERIETLANPGAVNYSAFSPDGRVLAVPSSLNRIELWDTSSFTSRRSRIPDFDGDGAVGFFDFIGFVQKFGFSRGQAGYDPRYDLDEDGAIGFADFLIFAGAFGKASSSS